MKKTTKQRSLVFYLPCYHHQHTLLSPCVCNFTLVQANKGYHGGTFLLLQILMRAVFSLERVTLKFTIMLREILLSLSHFTLVLEHSPAKTLRMSTSCPCVLE